MKGLIGKKLGMTSVFTEDGKQIPCTVIEAGPCWVVQRKTKESDGYEAVQLGYGEVNTKHVNKPSQGHFKNAGVEPTKKLIEFRDYDIAAEIGEALTVEIFEEGEIVNVIGQSKGKGFQGVVKRHGFSGVGMATHGQHNRQRAPGSIGASSFPSRVFKGMKMAGRTGNDRNKMMNLRIVRVLPEDNILLIMGAVPGHKGAFVIIEK